MGNKPLIDAMEELKARLCDREHHAHELNRLDGEIPALKDQVIALFAGEMLEAGATLKATRAPKKIGRPKGCKGGRRNATPSIASSPAIEALETIKASGPEGVPPRELHTKPWVIGLLARAEKARKLPNGNWVAA